MSQDGRELGREALTARQREIAELVARGYTNQQIARELVISPGTAANHLQQILRRLGLNSRSDLSSWISQHGLATPKNRLLATLERLLEIVPRDLDAALDPAALAVAEALGAEKVDAFLYEPETSTLVARGTSPTDLGRKQHALGLHRLPIANGGRTVEVFQTGTPRRAGRVDLDAEELRGIRVGLGVRSEIGVTLDVGGQRRGVLAAVSTAPQFFSEGDLHFLGTVSRWVGVVAERAELMQRAESEAAEEARRIAAEELITVLAHDFRNLLTPLRGRLDLVGRRARREGQDRYASDASELIRTVDRLDRLVRDLLDTARLKQGLFDLTYAPVDLVELVQTTLAEVAPQPDLVQVCASLDELVVSADGARLRQVLENLLSNALKVQPQDRPVLVVLDATQESATLSVQDNGPGIADEILPYLFQRFRAGSGSAGLGLGLYIAHGIVEAHGGSLEVDSRPGQGATFVVHLPVAEKLASARPARGARDSQTQNGSTTGSLAEGPRVPRYVGTSASQPRN